MNKKFYIEVGAHDGIFQSQTKSLEESGEWNGMLIEPNPYLFNQCVSNRNNDTNIFVNKCLVPRDYKKDTITFFDYDLFGAGGRIEKYFIGSEPLGQKIEVPTANINKLLEDNNINVIDFFSIDVEGADIDILDSINFDEREYKEIVIELHYFKDDMINYVKNKYRDLFNIEVITDDQVHLRLTKK